MFRKEKLLDELNKKGWSRYRLSKESGVAQTTLRDIFGEKQVTPSTKTLERIALALEVPIGSFFKDERELSNTNIDVEMAVSEPSKSDADISKNSEKDIKNFLSEALNLLKNTQDMLMFDGEPLDDLTRELLIQCLDHSMRIAKRTTKK